VRGASGTTGIDDGDWPSLRSGAATHGSPAARAPVPVNSQNAQQLSPGKLRQPGQAGQHPLQASRHHDGKARIHAVCLCP
jgi:hypothetical protein